MRRRWQSFTTTFWVRCDVLLLFGLNLTVSLQQVKRLLAKEDNDVASPPPLAPLSLPSAASSQSDPARGAPSPKTAASSTPAPAPASVPPLPNPRVATLARLKEMGVSFINPSEPQLSEQSVFLPRAQLPSQSVFQVTQLLHCLLLNKKPNNHPRAPLLTLLWTYQVWPSSTSMIIS